MAVRPFALGGGGGGGRPLWVVGGGGRQNPDRRCGPPSPTLPRKGGGSRRYRGVGPFTRRDLRGPALRESARAAGARRAIATELIEPDIEIDAIAAEPALGEHGRSEEHTSELQSQ